MSAPRLKFLPPNRTRETGLIHILSKGDVNVADLYVAIRAWQASVDGMAFADTVIRTKPRALPGGGKTPMVLTLIHGWQFESDNDVHLVGGLVTAEGADGAFSHPVAQHARSRVHIPAGDVAGLERSTPRRWSRTYQFWITTVAGTITVATALTALYYLLK